MNIGIRRFILRLIVGLLTFIIGVAAVMALGGFRPFQSYTISPNYNYRRGVSSGTLRAEPAFEYHYGDGCRGMRHYDPPPPPPPMMDAPSPPSPPRAVR